MNQPSASAASPAFIRLCANALLRRAAAAMAALRRRRRLELAALPAGALDERALRDLGLCRSEFASFWSESVEEAEHTRLRLAILRGGGACR